MLFSPTLRIPRTLFIYRFLFSVQCGSTILAGLSENTEQTRWCTTTCNGAQTVTEIMPTYVNWNTRLYMLADASQTHRLCMESKNLLRLVLLLTHPYKYIERLSIISLWSIYTILEEVLVGLWQLKQLCDFLPAALLCDKQMQSCHLLEAVPVLFLSTIIESS